MPERRLQLVVDPDLGPALWARERTGPGRSRPMDDLAPLAAAAPGDLGAVLAPLGGTLRHRVRDEASGRRVPARALAPGELTALLDALLAHLRGMSSAPDAVVARAAELADAGQSLLVTPARLDDASEESGDASEEPADPLVLLPGVLAAIGADDDARGYVDRRHVAPQLHERHGEQLVSWAPLTADAGIARGALLGALVDARAREAFAASERNASERDASKSERRTAGGEPVLGDARSGAAPADPRGFLASLVDASSPLDADIPAARAISQALRDTIASGRGGVQLTSTDLDLVIRLHEPPVGTAWPLQTCLREPDGTVHPVADLRAVGDVTAAGAAEAAGEILRLAPTVRTAQVDGTGTDWFLSTTEASAFLAHDAPALDAAGVVVMLPRDWTKVRATIRAEAQDAAEGAGEKKGAVVGMGAMMSFRWSVAVGDTELTEDEIAEIRDAQSELVHLRGEWVRLDQGTVRAAERFLEAFAAKARRTGSASAAGAPSAEGTASNPSDEPANPGMQPPPPRTQRGRPADPIADALRLREVGIGPAEREAGEQSEAGPDAAEPREPAQPTPAVAASGDLSLREYFRLMSSMAADGADVSSLTASGQVGMLLDSARNVPELPAPSSLLAVLRPYQKRGLDWMWALDSLGMGGILADDMGLGKTMQVLALLARERKLATEAGETVGPTLLVCPMSVVGSWQREAATFAPGLSVHVHHGGDRIRDHSFVEGALDTDIVLTTYALLARDLPVLQQVPWHRVVLDEAQHIKNPQTAVARAARALPEGRRLLLTGTPVENRLSDLHSLMEVANPGILGSAAEFQQRIADPIEKDGDPSAVARLNQLTGPFILRRVKTDRSIIQDLPEKTELVQRTNLTPEQAGLYEALVAEMLVELDGASPNKRRGVVVSTLTKLKQVSNHPAHYLQDGSALLRDGAHRSGKLERVDDILEAAFERGEKVLIFTQFTSFARMLLPYWEEKFGMRIPFLHGGVPKSERDDMVARFQATPDHPGAMILSLRAGGTGLTLTAANHVIHLDRWWNPAVENQATDRAFRIGQRKDVQVSKMVSAGTIEERIDTVLAEKSDLADLAVGSGGGEGWIASLGDAELADLLRLDPDQVGGAAESQDEDDGEGSDWTADDGGSR